MADDKNFSCSLCPFKSSYTYFGNKPPFSKYITLLEDAFVVKDPFSKDGSSMIVIGGICSLCRKHVCISANCSTFYTARFCSECVNENLSEFPKEIQQEQSKNREHMTKST